MKQLYIGTIIIFFAVKASAEPKALLVSTPNSLSSPSKNGGAIPHEQEPFLDNLKAALDGLDTDFKDKAGSRSAPERLLNSLIANLLRSKLVEATLPLRDLNIPLPLMQTIERLSKKEGPQEKIELKLSDLKNALVSSAGEFTDAEKTQLISLLLVHLKKSHTKDKSMEQIAKSIIIDFLKTQQALAPNKPIALSEALQKSLGLITDAKPKVDPEQLKPGNLLSILKDKEVSDFKVGLDLLSNLIQKHPVDPERLDLFLAPIQKQFFEALLDKEPTIAFPEPLSFENALSNLNAHRAELDRRSGPRFEGPVPLAHRIDIRPGGIGFQGGGFQQGGPGVSGVPNPRAAALGDLTDRETADIKACLDSVKAQKRYNVELSLPGSLCASTAISTNPQSEMANFKTQAERGEFCTIHLATAVHCVNSTYLPGREIETNVGNRRVATTILSVGSVDPNGGAPVSQGNPDLALMTVKMPCQAATNLNLAKLPTPSEIEQLRAEKIAVVMQQNSDINASLGASNQATIAAAGAISGNYAAFNSNLAMNHSSGAGGGNSKRIQSGDSGGTALSCKMSKPLGENERVITDILYLGAISHIDVTGDAQEGLTGGIASGNSLMNLSKMMGAGTSQHFEKVPRSSEPATNNTHVVQRDSPFSR